MSYTATGTFSSGNIFTAQLSDVSGSFTSPTAIGSISSTSSGTIAAIIPANTPDGTGYRIRVVSSSPVVTGGDNGSDFNIYSIPQATIFASGPTTFCDGDSVVLNSNTGTGLTWQWREGGSDISGATASSFTAVAAGSYSVLITNGGMCYDESLPVTVTVLPLPSATITAQGSLTICEGNSVQLQANAGTGLSYQWIRNSSDIPGAIQQQYSAVSAGTYVVRVTSQNSCAAVSSSVTVIVIPGDPTILTWTGSIGSDWSTVGNWDSPCAIPTIGDTVIVPSGMQPPVSVPAISLSVLTLDNASGLQLSGNMNITGGLNLQQGCIDLGTHDLRISYPAGISGASSSRFIVTSSSGRLQFTAVGAGAQSAAVLFPVGPSSGNYTPLTLQNSGAIDIFSVRAADGVYSSGTSGNPVHTHVVDKTWFVDERHSGGSDVTLRLQWNFLDELPDFSRMSCRISEYSGTIWQPVHPPVTANGSNPYYVNASSITSLGIFAVASHDAAFPVELSSFSARATSRGVLLEWTTESEHNNHGFEIQRRSNPASTWQTRAFVHGQGASISAHTYSWCDAVEPGQYHYRLRQLDNDGAVNYSVELLVTMLKPGLEFALEQNYPNPFNPSTRIEFTVTENSDVKLEVFDAYGRLLQTLVDERLEAGSHNVEFHARDIPSGVYLYRLATGAQSRTRAMLLLR